MKTTLQPLLQAGLGRREVDRCHSDLGESEYAGPLPNAGHQLESIDLSHRERHAPIVKTAPGHQGRQDSTPFDSALRLVWRDENDTQAFAAALSAQPGIGNLFIALQGELGAGKTTLVRHLLRALGVTGRIKSPTYAVVEPHQVDARNLSIWHFDFYRFNDPREWEDAGFRDIFSSAGLKIAEWPDKAAAVLPVPDLTIAIDMQDDETRSVAVTPGTHAGTEIAAALHQGN